MNTRSTTIATLLAALAIALAGMPFGLTAVQATQQAQPTPIPHEGHQPQADMHHMMMMHQQMMADMKAAEARLDALVRDMNAANRDTKVEAVAAVVNELVRQQRAMHGRMSQMHEHMMGGHGMMMKR